MMRDREGGAIELEVEVGPGGHGGGDFGAELGLFGGLCGEFWRRGLEFLRGEEHGNAMSPRSSLGGVLTLKSAASRPGNAPARASMIGAKGFTGPYP
jgi:hypothetical protein